MGDENAELGIAITQSQASAKRLSQKDGIRQQQAWSASYFNDRIAVYLAVLCLFAVLFVWLVDVSWSLRIAVTVATFVVGVYVIISIHKKKMHIEHLRDSQVRDHTKP